MLQEAIPNIKSEIEQMKKEIEAVKNEHAEVKTEISEKRKLLNEMTKGENNFVHKTDANEDLYKEKETGLELLDQIKNEMKEIEQFVGYRCDLSAENEKKFSFFGKTTVGQQDETQITVLLGQDENGSKVIQDIQMDEAVKSQEVTDLINECVLTNNIVALLLKFKDTWLRKHDLLSEIKHLQNSYAVDWQSQNNKFLVMFDSVICSLHVPKNFPYEGKIQLQSIEGYECDIATLQPNDENAGLTDWVKYLKDKIEGERT